MIWFLRRLGLGLQFAIPFALVSAMNTQAASEKIVFNFKTATNPSAWQVINEDVMGGVSTSELHLTNGIAVFSGEVSLEKNGGFASVRSLPFRHDIVGCDSFLIRVRGDGRSYKFTVRTESSFDSALYQTVFATKNGEWEEHTLALKQFEATFRGRSLPDEPPLDPAKVASVGFLISDKQKGPFRLEVAWIKAAARMRQ